MHCIGPPNIFRSSVVRWARKVKQSKIYRCCQGILLLNSVFPCKERDIYDILHSKDTENLKKVKIRKTWLMTKKIRSSEFLDVKMGIFSPKKGHSEIWVREKIFSPPQILRQVSAHAPTCRSPPMREAKIRVHSLHSIPGSLNTHPV